MRVKITHKINTKAKYALICLMLVWLALVWLSQGRFTGARQSPNGQYILKYYLVRNPFKIDISMPGGSSCKPMRVRLYDKEGHVLNTRLTMNCNLEMQPHWVDDQLLLGDGKTIWHLPSSAEQ